MAHQRKLLAAAFFVVALNLAAQPDSVRQHIRRQMPMSTRTREVDSAGHLALPYPYSVPQAKGTTFMNMFYWDTYFTNLGLLSIGDVQQAKNNVDNIVYLIEKFGYMPNASNVSLLNRSQPPYASMMARDVYEKTGDREWLLKVLRTLEKEYAWWMSERVAPNGLNRHGNSATEEELTEFFIYLRAERFPFLRDRDFSREDILRIASGYLSEAESGWDFNPRFEGRCEDFNPLDLNANLYLYEKNFAWFYRELGLKGASVWEKKAAARRKLMLKLFVDPKTGLMYDYDYVNGRLSKVYSAAVFNALWAGIPSRARAVAIVRELGRLECEHAVSACEENDAPVVYQWDRPNAWASFNTLAVAGLDRYGYKAEARRIASKYVESVSAIFGRTQQLWEKFNAVTGDIDVKDEYAMPGDFMGWTAGAFIYCQDYLAEN